MTSSERVSAILSIREHLMYAEWSVGDMVLRQFGIPTSDKWDGKWKDYLVAMLEKAQDTNVIALLSHFTPSLDTEEESPEFWRKGFFRLFVSHVSRIKGEAFALKESLAKLGITAFVAHEDIQPTKEWVIEIDSALKTMDALTALITGDFHESLWTDQEVGFAMGRQALVIPIRIGHDPYGFVGRYQGVSANGKTASQIAASVFDTLIANPKTSPRLSSAVTRLFCESASYADAKQNAILLTRCKALTEQDKQLIRDAVKTNDQIKDAFGVPGRVKAILVAK